MPPSEHLTHQVRGSAIAFPLCQARCLAPGKHLKPSRTGISYCFPFLSQASHPGNGRNNIPQKDAVRLMRAFTKPSKEQPRKPATPNSFSGLKTADGTSAKRDQAANGFTEGRCCNVGGVGVGARSRARYFNAVFCSVSFQNLSSRETQPLETESHLIELSPHHLPIGSRETASAMTSLGHGEP